MKNLIKNFLGGLMGLIFLSSFAHAQTSAAVTLMLTYATQEALKKNASTQENSTIAALPKEITPFMPPSNGIKKLLIWSFK